jgi:ribosome-binding factor A
MQKNKSEILHLPFIIISQRKLGIEGIYLSILNTNYNKSKAKIALNGKKSEFISSKSMENTMVNAVPNIIQHTV